MLGGTLAQRPTTVDEAIASFGAAAMSKLNAVSVRGEPEDQLRNPLETLLADLAALAGLDPAKLVLVGESSLAEMHTRPDFAVTYDHALVGYIEVKAPDKGTDPRRFRTGHDKQQWQRLSALPNLIYTNGNGFILLRDGEAIGDVEHLVGDVRSSGSDLRPSPGLLPLVANFLGWTPSAPRTTRQLAQTAARLCRLLRDEVSEQLDRKDAALTTLAQEWKQLLFPKATESEFADGYAQAVTFGLLLARAENIPLDAGIDAAARKLGKSHSLIGTALRILTDEAVQSKTLVTSVQTLTRVLAVVDWSTLTKGDPEAWLYFYELFLAEYDSDLRRKTGSYYTPPEVVEAMTALVDEAVRGRLSVPAGLADDGVTIVDPAMGTGTFLLSVVRTIAGRIEDDLGAGAVPGELSKVLRRVIGFELQLGPFAVAQLRLLAELVELGLPASASPPLRTYATNTLDNPYVEDEHLGVFYEPIARSRREANEIKKDEAVLVVLGNPPYRERARTEGGWIEQGTEVTRALLRDFVPPPDWGVSAHVKHLYNHYVYFWRWALWKVFEHHAEADRGVICFITVAGFIDGPGFARMREWMRSKADEIWVIDCSPEGHQPAVSSRVFEAVQQPVCIVLAVRDGSSGTGLAPVRHRTLAAGNRRGKFDELAGVSLGDGGWRDCDHDGRAPFTPSAESRWASFPSLDDVFTYSGSGTMPGRTWVVAPDADTLRQRWRALVSAKPEHKPDLMSEHKRDRRIDTRLKDNLSGYPATSKSLGEETGDGAEPLRIGYRSFDRQWIIPDKRLINQPNPRLWAARSEQQVHLTALSRSSPTAGPGVTFSALVPDLDHYKGSFGGRAYPLWLDAGAATSNVRPALLASLEARFQRRPTGPDIMAYLAAVCAHPGYPATFADDLTNPGIRVPITTDAELFAQAADLGRRLIWLHAYGQRFADPAAGRPKGAPRMDKPLAPRVSAEYPMPTGPATDMPDELRHDAATGRLHVGSGVIEHVTAEMWRYEVSGVRVLTKWFSYRRRSRERPSMGRRVSKLLDIQPDHWLPDYTRDLIDLLNVLGLLVDLEPRQAEILDKILTGPLLDVADLAPAPSGAGASSPGSSNDTLAMFDLPGLANEQEST